MPYRKKGTRSVRRRRPVGRVSSVKYVKRVARREVNKAIETKQKQNIATSFYDEFGGTASFGSVSYGGTAATFALGRNVLQGTTSSSRVGTKIRVLGLSFYFLLQQGSGNFDDVRILVYTPYKGALTGANRAANVSDLLSTYSGSTTQYLMPVNTDKFKVYYDRVFRLEQHAADGSTSASVPGMKVVRKHINIMRNLTYNYDESTPQNDFYITMISNSAVAPNPGAVAGYIKYWWKDA